ncbi:hybrid sensor histidine kinase/response regulator [Dyadobacter luteus]|jgi:signal transduction histidine kinase/DNA-binding response OmpR family regulator|uniref:histidine kinase n=1 Tax=Dyadobacter luteus TaxID=2259619 RepID=A0A3D8Y8T4_9BACT|nr:response regulator [Dyadobacter luteus]REA59747.1 hybrid sensor histidine kinase/response regulator [Dyadobacter luteus]
MILIVDDRPENILPLKRILEMHGYRTDSAESGEEALKKVLSTDYSVIIMDVQMPGMDGFEVAEAMSGFSKAKDIPIIFLSAVNKEKKFITKGYSSGGIDYLTKPVDTDILLLKIRTFKKLFEQQQELKSIQVSLQKEIEIRKQAQEELDGRNTELHSVLESLPQIAFTMNVSGHIEYVNAHWYNYSDDAHTFPEVHVDDHVVCHQFMAQLQHDGEFSREIRLVDKKNNGYRHFLFTAIPVQQQEITVKWVGTFTNIDQQKVAHEILEKQVSLRTSELVNKNAELETSNHELQQFAWVVSHDLKEPLRKIQTFSHLVKDKFLAGNDEAISYLDRSIGASARMSLLISDLLDYSRLSVQASFSPTNINQLIDDILEDFKEAIAERNVQISIDAIPTIDTIPSQIRQVFQNLISNALKFSRNQPTPVISIQSELTDQLSVESAAIENGDYCRITIEDNGIGFDEKFLDRIFVIFQRLNNQRNYEGTGIGLAIAKKIIDKHNGLISAQSKENQGARFIVVLPVIQSFSEPVNSTDPQSTDEKNV